ncbi:MAG: hypothetical protein DI548_16995, partial [Flavobacterium johnsoniae]
MKHLTFLFFLLSVSVQAQFQVSGIVRDENTKKPLPFATITGTSFSTVTDVDGKFLLQNENQINSFTISYIGYAPKTIAVTGNKKYYDLLL